MDNQPQSSANPSLLQRILLRFAQFVVLASLVALVYGRAINSPFIFDDASAVLTNRSIMRIWPPVGDDARPGPLNPRSQLPTAGRPLVNLTLAVNFYFGRFNPAGYRLFNMAVHVLNAMLLSAIVRRTLRLPRFSGRFDSAAEPISWIVAVMWALHPLQTEPVVYVTQRTELLVGFFYFATLYASQRYWAATSRNGRITWTFFAAFCCALGMACKEVMVTAPVIVWLYERIFISDSLRASLRKSWLLYAVLAASWSLLVLLNYNGPRAASAGFHLGVPVAQWWFTQAKVLLMYLKLTVWPWPLVIHYDTPYLIFSDAWPSALVVSLLVLATLIGCWRHSAIAFVVAWVLIILLPTSVVPITTEVAAERRMYLPMAGLTSLFVVLGYRLAGQFSAHPSHEIRNEKRKTALIATAIPALLIAVVWALVDVRRMAAYRDELSIWEDTLVHQPDNYIVHNSLALALYKRGNFEDALKHYQKSLELKPNYPDAHYNVGIMLFELGREHPEAVAHFREALHLNPEMPLAENAMGLALASMGITDQAITHLEEAIRLNPDMPPAHNNLGFVLAANGRTTEAIDHFQTALKLDPDYANAHFNLGKVLSKTHHPEEAIGHYEHALEVQPENAETCARLAAAYADVGNFEQAVINAERAIAMAKSRGQDKLVDVTKRYVEAYRDELRKHHGSEASK